MVKRLKLRQGIRTTLAHSNLNLGALHDNFIWQVENIPDSIPTATAILIADKTVIDFFAAQERGFIVDFSELGEGKIIRTATAERQTKLIIAAHERRKKIFFALVDYMEGWCEEIPYHKRVIFSGIEQFGVPVSAMSEKLLDNSVRYLVNHVQPWDKKALDEILKNCGWTAEEIEKHTSGVLENVCG